MSEILTHGAGKLPPSTGLRNSAANLPNEVLLHIFSYVTCEDLWNCKDVCVNWSNAAMDHFLWQTKLCELLGTRWSVICCDKKPQIVPDFRDLNVLHPCNIYRFLYHYVPPHLHSRKESSTPINTLDTTDLEPFRSRNFRPTIGEYILNWWNQIVRRFSMTTARRASRPTPQPFRYAVFGPGFDARATSRLFSKLVDARTKSFEPTDMIPGRMGFGAGLTLRLYGQAQRAAYDPSLRPHCTPPIQKDSLDGALTPTGLSPNGTPISTPINTRRGQTESANPLEHTPRNFLQSRKLLDDTPPMEDFIFDLHYLYAFHGHINDTYNYQRERILGSRLFSHPDLDEKITDTELLASLTVSESMQSILNGLNGMIYAIDARESLEQSLYLYYELQAVLRGLPAYIAKSVPIVILYIMPKEEIPLEPFPVRTVNRSNITEGLNRDSYSGAEYTVSWRGSLLLPISCLRLFELPNPWRLQKCASNDIKAVIQSIMWLKSRSPVIRTGDDPVFLRSNSAV
ncbi:Cyclin F box [Fasciola gigantica]|uniref:Cyclin F box n=1 Tax=Fasciola gigantica TaxID=46835 RepID=A0A504YVY6_FASGI|nr:Cyclin F box [Fasciola gigantica]